MWQLVPGTCLHCRALSGYENPQGLDHVVISDGGGALITTAEQAVEFGKKYIDHEICMPGSNRIYPRLAKRTGVYTQFVGGGGGGGG